VDRFVQKTNPHILGWLDSAMMISIPGNSPHSQITHMIRLLALLLLFVPSLLAKGPVYVVLWFDTEDYIEPAADDSALRIATDLTNLDVRATFKLVGEKARVLEGRGRTDVIRALSQHAIGYHSNFHSIQPAPAVYLRRLGFLEGAEEFERREEPGVLDLKRIFGVYPICYGQPGSSWAPQVYAALRRMGIPVYLDDGTQVGLNEQPFWYGGILNIYNLGQYSIRPDLDHEENNTAIHRKFSESAERLANSGGGVISTYFHPTEFVTTEFWDAVNFKGGEVRNRSDWVKPHKRTASESERCFRVLRAYVEHAKQTPGVQFITAQDLLQRCKGPIPPQIDRRKSAAFLKQRITFLRTGTDDFSAADLLLNLLELQPQIVDGPTSGGKTTYGSGIIPEWLFDKAKKDASSFITAHHRLPSEVFLGAETLSLADFAATVAGQVLSPGPIHVLRGNVEFEKYFSTDSEGSFKWPIHPKGFSAPELLELARLQGWTLKPARLR
jgi:hypothetical protein